MLSYRHISTWLRPDSCSRIARIRASFVWRFLLMSCGMVWGLWWVGNPRAIISTGTSLRDLPTQTSRRYTLNQTSSRKGQLSSDNSPDCLNTGVLGP